MEAGVLKAAGYAATNNGQRPCHVAVNLVATLVFHGAQCAVDGRACLFHHIQNSAAGCGCPESGHGTSSGCGGREHTTASQGAVSGASRRHGCSKSRKPFYATLGRSIQRHSNAAHSSAHHALRQRHLVAKAIIVVEGRGEDAHLLLFFIRQRGAVHLLEIKLVQLTPNHANVPGVAGRADYAGIKEP